MPEIAQTVVSNAWQGFACIIVGAGNFTMAHFAAFSEKRKKKKQRSQYKLFIRMNLRICNIAMNDFAESQRDLVCFLLKHFLHAYRRPCSQKLM